jgi:hypothetical protein
MTTFSLFNYVDSLASESEAPTISPTLSPSGITVDCTQCGQSKCSSRTAYDDLELDAENFEAELDTVEVANY